MATDIQDTSTGSTETKQCPICLAEITGDEVVLDKCKHRFCKSCIARALKSNYRCPVCRKECGEPRGNQPNGTMKSETASYFHLPGYPDDNVITIRYNIPSGMQTADHPNPGSHFTGITRTAFLPDNQEGKEVLRLLEIAFEARLVFTVGRSVTSGQENIVTWNDIHHKTNMSGGPTRYGYPDPDYLKRVKEDLAAKGIV
ncbi:probable E3 ubiquitin-protein ligase DTX3 [Patiria miniata]|uniref:E3 ubiquitin-protein ligase n=1 Tax=Patiria miniata TaxID=46514 RepID=A0A914B6Q5_PATMI|nr:probable E3 ubiquitin-protein ligase DTX3 [Patiria miniata]